MSAPALTAIDHVQLAIPPGAEAVCRPYYADLLGMTEDDISHFNGLGYSKSLEEAKEKVESGEVDAAFFMRATPVEQVREVAETGESMPPKSTYFYPKVPTGLVFNPLA